MCYQPTSGQGLTVGGAYYVLDRLADPMEFVTLIRPVGENEDIAVVRGTRGTECTVARRHLSLAPAAVVYRELLAKARKQ